MKSLSGNKLINCYIKGIALQLIGNKHKKVVTRGVGGVGVRRKEIERVENRGKEEA